MAATIRGRFGPGCWAITPWPNTGFTATRRKRKPGWSRSAIISAMPGWARSAKSSTARRRIIRVERRRKHLSGLANLAEEALLRIARDWKGLPLRHEGAAGARDASIARPGKV